MRLIRRPRAWLASGILVLALAVPLPSVAQELSGGPATPDTLVGALLAVVCGASINVARVFPHPLVVATAIGSCAGAFLDAISTPD